MQFSFVQKNWKPVSFRILPIFLKSFTGQNWFYALFEKAVEK